MGGRRARASGHGLTTLSRRRENFQRDSFFSLSTYTRTLKPGFAPRISTNPTCSTTTKTHRRQTLSVTPPPYRYLLVPEEGTDVLVCPALVPNLRLTDTGTREEGHAAWQKRAALHRVSLRTLLLQNSRGSSSTMRATTRRTGECRSRAQDGSDVRVIGWVGRVVGSGMGILATSTHRQGLIHLACLRFHENTSPASSSR